MDEEPQSSWRERESLFLCHEPYRTQLDTLANHWVEGALNHEEMALEMWKVKLALLAPQSNRRQQNSGSWFRSKRNLKDVEEELNCLATAVCNRADDREKEQATPEMRLKCLYWYLDQVQDRWGHQR